MGLGRQGPVVAGIAGAVAAVLVLVGWNWIEDWLITGSAYTDLRGQDTLSLVSITLGSYVVVALIALIAGRLSGRLCRSHLWLAAVVSVIPLILVTLVSPRRFWFWYICAPLIALCGAYVPTWLSRQSRAHA